MNLENLPIYIVIYIGLFISIFYLLTFFELKTNNKTLFKGLGLKKFPPITIIIPAYNEEKAIASTIKATISLKYGGRLSVFVIDDGSTDNTADIVRGIAKRDKRVRLFSKGNGGKSDAVNFGIKRAKTELIAVLDADTKPKKDALEKAVRYFADEKIMAVTCRTIPSNKNSFFTRMQHVEYVLLSFFRSLLTQMNSLQIVPAFSVFRTSFFKKHGGFDVGNLTEDLEMGLRIKNYGYDIAYITDSYAKTKVPERFRDLTRQRIRWGYGLFYNFYKYRHVFSPRFGDLGMFFMPATAVTVSVLIFIFFYALHELYFVAAKQLSKLVVINLPLLFPLNINFTNLALLISDSRIILGLFGFLMALTMFFLAKTHIKEELSFGNYLQYIFLYSWLVTFFYVVSAIHLLIKKPGW